MDYVAFVSIEGRLQMLSTDLQCSEINAPYVSAITQIQFLATFMIVDYIDHVADGLRRIQDIFNFYINLYSTF